MASGHRKYRPDRETLKGGRVGISITGGNVDSGLFADVLAGKH